MCGYHNILCLIHAIGNIIFNMAALIIIRMTVPCSIRMTKAARIFCIWKNWISALYCNFVSIWFIFLVSLLVLLLLASPNVCNSIKKNCDDIERNGTKWEQLNDNKSQLVLNWRKRYGFFFIFGGKRFIRKFVILLLFFLLGLIVSDYSFGGKCNYLVSIFHFLLHLFSFDLANKHVHRLNW